MMMADRIKKSIKVQRRLWKNQSKRNPNEKRVRTTGRAKQKPMTHWQWVSGALLSLSPHFSLWICGHDRSEILFSTFPLDFLNFILRKLLITKSNKVEASVDANPENKCRVEISAQLDLTSKFEIGPACNAWNGGNEEMFLQKNLSHA